MKNVRARETLIFFEVISLLLGTGCSTARSVASAVPGASLVPGLSQEDSTGPKEGETLHFKISPDEALEILAKVAPEHEWELDAVGDQYDLQGLRGKYFRLLTRRFIGGVFEMNGVFFSETEGTYVKVGKKDIGFPQELVEPFTAAVEARMSASKSP
jgi:hypothetical protein